MNQLRDMANEDQLKEQILSQAIDSTNETNNHILLNDLKEIIARALEQLTPRQREVFKMSRELQMSHTLALSYFCVLLIQREGN